MDVSENGGTPKSSIFHRVFHYKPSILGYPYFWKHPYCACFGFSSPPLKKIKEWIGIWGDEIHTPWKMNWAVLIVMCKWASQGRGVEHQPVHMEPENAPGFFAEDIYISGWWFQIFFIFIPTWGNDPMWLIFFGWVGSTTNQIYILGKFCPKPWKSSRPNKECYFLDDPCKRFPATEGQSLVVLWTSRENSSRWWCLNIFSFHPDPWGNDSNIFPVGGSTTN